MSLPRTSGWPTDSPSIALDDHFTLDVVTVTGRASVIEFQLRDDQVEIWHHHRLTAAVDRTVLRGWLARPERSLIVGDVMFNLDCSIDVRDRAAISLDHPQD